jgi:hypothetical protein
LKLDESCTSNSKSEIGNWTVQFAISDFEFEVQDSSNFKFPFEECLPHLLVPKILNLFAKILPLS